MNLTDHLNILLDAYAQCLADELADKRLFEKKEVQAMLKTRAWLVLHDALALVLKDDDTLRLELVAEYNHKLTHSGRKKQIAVMLANLNAEIVAAKKVKYTMMKQMDYDVLKDWVKNRYGDAAFQKFIKTLNK
jgi:hypothetical protein